MKKETSEASVELFPGICFVLENPKGSYKSFETEGDPVWDKYPLKGVTYPVDYGYIEGYLGEDGAELDMFVGSGALNGFIKVSRMDVPEETKFFWHLTMEEKELVLNAFQSVLLESQVFSDIPAFLIAVMKFKKD